MEIKENNLEKSFIFLCLFKIFFLEKYNYFSFITYCLNYNTFFFLIAAIFFIFFTSIRRTESTPETPLYKYVMRLTITNVQHSDFGIYKCVAKNPRGETDGTIRLYCEYNEKTYKKNILKE
jgi:hypothetical protein